MILHLPVNLTLSLHQVIGIIPCSTMHYSKIDMLTVRSGVGSIMSKSDPREYSNLVRILGNNITLSLIDHMKIYPPGDIRNHQTTLDDLYVSLLFSQQV